MITSTQYFHAARPLRASFVLAMQRKQAGRGNPDTPARNKSQEKGTGRLSFDALALSFLRLMD